MKRILFVALVALLAAMPTFAKTEQSPDGLYKLLQFIYEDGRTRTPGFSQYKYAADSVGLLVSYSDHKDDTRWNNLTVEIREPYPLKYTGEKPQGNDGHGTQVFNVNDRQFYFKWYNDRWPGMSKLNEFITEVYVKEGIETEVQKAFNLLEGKVDTKVCRFYGWWQRIGVTANPDGTGKRMQAPALWKAYGPDLSLVVTISNNGKNLMCNPTSTVRYDNDTTIWEIGHRCDIHWINEDTHTLTFMQNGKPLTEIWVRSGLPSMWQKIFHTDIPLFRDGTLCMRDAVMAARSGDMKKAEELIDEALNVKQVGMSALCEGIGSISTQLLMEKKQYKDCIDFSERYLKIIKDKVEDGNDLDALSRLMVHQTETNLAVATYRNGEQEKGRKLMEERLSIVDSEIEKFKAIKGMEGYVNALYYCNLMMYDLGYDVFGAERTLLYLDALTIMAPGIAQGNKPLILKCRGNCYLLNGDKDSARKLWQQLKDLDASFLKNQPDDCPLKQAFGE